VAVHAPQTPTRGAPDQPELRLVVVVEATRSGYRSAVLYPSGSSRTWRRRTRLQATPPAPDADATRPLDLRGLGRSYGGLTAIPDVIRGHLTAADGFVFHFGFNPASPRAATVTYRRADFSKWPFCVPGTCISSRVYRCWFDHGPEHEYVC
jgi:hypothetical protein